MGLGRGAPCRLRPLVGRIRPDDRSAAAQSSVRLANGARPDDAMSLRLGCSHAVEEMTSQEVWCRAAFRDRA